MLAVSSVAASVSGKMYVILFIVNDRSHSMSGGVFGVKSDLFLLEKSQNRGTNIVRCKFWKSFKNSF